MIESLNSKFPSWISNTGPYPDIVFLSKVSLYRNIEGYNFTIRAKDEEKSAIYESLTEGIKTIKNLNNIYPIFELLDYEREFMFERHFIPYSLIQDGKHSAVVLNNEQNNILLINADEHLQISSISSGFEIEEPYNQCDQIDDNLNTEFVFSFDKKLGFLTSSPMRVGTGLKISVFVYIPAIVITSGVTDLIGDLDNNNFSMDGTYIDSGGVMGSLFKIKNEFALGISEDNIIEKTRKQVQDIIQKEIDAREYLMKNARYETEDKIWRSYGIITNARFLSLGDFLNLASAVRLGVGLGLIKNISIIDLNRWTIQSQPGHLNLENGGNLDIREENILRAKLIRENTGR
jgi:protein arginine kinase